MSRVLPILFNTAMVQAILDGRKMVTRRAIKKLDIEEDNGMVTLYERNQDDAFSVSAEKDAKEGMATYCRYQPGDILYVRETWQYLYELDGNDQIIEDTGRYYYAATDILPFDTYVDPAGITHQNIPWKPSIHMPKEAARIWLKVTNVRVERLREITEEQAIKEGFEGVRCSCGGTAYACTDCYNTGWIEPPYVGFMYTWDSTIKKPDLDKYGWKANPWVWVIEFERCGKPESEG